MSQPHFVEIIIRSNRPWWVFRLREIWSQRDLMWLLIRRDFLSRYRQTILGPAWYIVQPLITVGIFTIIFGRFAGISTDGLPHFLFYQAGLLGFTLTSQVFSGTATSLTSNASLFGKVYFPRLIPPLATSAIQMVPFALQSLSFAGFWCYFRYFTESGEVLHFTGYAWMFPVIITQLLLLGLGLGLIFSALSAKYRDLSHLVPFVAQIWMYATPVIYPISEIPERWMWLAWINPVSPMVEWFRLSFLGVGSFDWGHYTFASLTGLVLLLIGFLAFQYSERTFIDTV